MCLRLAALLSVAALAARAECSAEFDGVWGWEAAVQGQCTVMTFANDSRKKQTGPGTWTNLGDDCSYRTPNMILEAEYDTLLHGNLTARMIDASTCELTFGKAHVSVDTYGVWAPLSKTA